LLDEVPLRAWKKTISWHLSTFPDCHDFYPMELKNHKLKEEWSAGILQGETRFSLAKTADPGALLPPLQILVIGYLVLIYR
jgi:hypothetical protein